MTATLPHAEWVAGLFEGEGCICLRTEHRCTLSISSVDRDVMERFYEYVGIGRLNEQAYLTQTRRKPRTKWVWESTRLEENQWFLYEVLPFLLARRSEKAQRVLAMRKQKRGPKPGVKRGPYKTWRGKPVKAIQEVA